MIGARLDVDDAANRHRGEIEDLSPRGCETRTGSGRYRSMTPSWMIRCSTRRLFADERDFGAAEARVKENGTP
jgi:hypothetical protein